MKLDQIIKELDIRIADYESDIESGDIKGRKVTIKKVHAELCDARAKLLSAERMEMLRF